MKFTATAYIRLKINTTVVVKNKITAEARLPVIVIGDVCPQYDLIDGGLPGTVYSPINGFNLIDGNP